MASSNKENIKEYKFLAELDDELKCMICLGVARDPLQHEECGKLFCKDCLEKHGKYKPCPNCRQENSHYYVDKRSKRHIDALGVKCHNAERKCSWKGTVATVEDHMNTCQFTLLPCPNQCKDNKNETNHFIRKEMRQHLLLLCPNRPCECQYCGQKGTYAAMMNTHKQICPKMPIPCPNKDCKATMQRELVSDHVERECAYTVLPCKYKSFGCKVEKKRRDMAAHEHADKQRHLDMAMDATLVLKNQVAELCSVVNILKLTSKTDLQAFKFTEFARKKEEDIRYEFQPFYSHPRGYHIVLVVNANGYGPGKGTHTSASISVVQGDYDADLKWPCLGTITISLLNQLEDKNHQSLAITLTAEDDVRAGSISGKVGTARGFPKFIPHSELDYDPVKNTQYLKNDTLYFKVRAIIRSL